MRTKQCFSCQSAFLLIRLHGLAEDRVDAEPWVGVSAQELQLFMGLPPNVLN